ncbi:MAG: hypothetical protein GKR89_37130 [Candidatus Latescibacteria bacterium]|nr:hypothetical protein [Candidatus Latescibacterota bacterium]
MVYQPLVSPLRLADVALDPLFASFYKTYIQEPVGTVALINDEPDSARVALGFLLPDWMRRPSQQELVLPPQSRRTVPLYVALEAAVLDLEDRVEVPAEITLSFASGDETIAIQKTADLSIYGRGALTWNSVGRAAAFITSTDPSVTALARSMLVAFEEQAQVLGRPGQNLLRALVLFEALKQHGVRYLPDANTPYSQIRAARTAVDHIQYPAQLLHSKAGDCDDLTVLYASLLENAGVATALVDYPGHIFLLFDTGVARRQAYQLPLAPKRYVVRGDRLWIPVEVTQLDQSFLQAWQTGLDALGTLGASALKERVVDTAVAWEQFPAASPDFEESVVGPAAQTLQTAFTDQSRTLQNRIDAYIDETYLDRLQSEPDNDRLRTQLLKVYLALGQSDKAIEQGGTYLLDERGDQAATLTHLGNAYAMQGNMTQAALYYKQALALRPADAGVQRNLALALQALGRSQAAPADSLALASTEGPKTGSTGLSVDSFYWME